MQIEISKLFLWNVLKCHIYHVLNAINWLNIEEFFNGELKSNVIKTKLISFIQQNSKSKH